ncbi:hypothetical protein ACFZDG_32075 [Kitasatospora xanthocidica]|uniref:hypothetical protein n=1 Tax=Kitasatospora xanthocidica TaxID=83382 RepID=UPI0036EE53E2
MTALITPIGAEPLTAAEPLTGAEQPAGPTGSRSNTCRPYGSSDDRRCREAPAP